MKRQKPYGCAAGKESFMKNQLIYILLYTFAVYFYMRLIGWWELEVKVLFFRVQRLLLLLRLMLLLLMMMRQLNLKW